MLQSHLSMEAGTETEGNSECPQSHFSHTLPLQHAVSKWHWLFVHPYEPDTGHITNWRAFTNIPQSKDRRHLWHLKHPEIWSSIYLLQSKYNEWWVGVQRLEAFTDTGAFMNTHHVILATCSTSKIMCTNKLHLEVSRDLRAFVNVPSLMWD